MQIFTRIVAASAAFAMASPAYADGATGLRGSIGVKPQYVLISFDNAGSNALWDRAFNLAQRSNAKFTYFLSCVFLIDHSDRKSYQAPGKASGRSNIGFASSKEDIAKRLDNIWRARNEGHEIGSHACGHFDGKNWTKAEWESELVTYRQVLSDAWAKYGNSPEPEGWKNFVAKEIRGFRAPYLSESPALIAALKDQGFTFDGSGVSKGPALPLHAGGLYQFGLPTIAEGPQNRPVIAMDYNMFVRHSGGFERTDHMGEFENRAYEAFKGAFERQYQGKRIPFQIGLHFTLMNGDAYWRALERFTAEVCTKADVRCTTYSDYLKETGGVEAASTPDLTQPQTGGGI
ncbi:peptidoglycan/xylan/chitin deacetylase (PgdA/CDA1 family) [Phyllobacterium ifriqiyense]|uniref:Chitooligosaccharide deacetylase n=1 Tax=Phyllobacterium ifriqiyense TaxID=314238 RepID=A0ABU0SCI0_9HYPH|nr:polysaccharide deacetylase family protein [Phyllobacterium ifriqiyense]MDQ0998351.1 peptidoglycan/xylan/chitin deacetylase (PgdA/CDA1 family) [Phyllobacterium ifriqiyense]